jgi:hypothetical protein
MEILKQLCATSTAHKNTLIRALEIAEAALADIGDSEHEPGDDLEWAEERAFEALPLIREVLKQHGGKTSELPTPEDVLMNAEEALERITKVADCPCITDKEDLGSITKALKLLNELLEKKE